MSLRKLSAPASPSAATPIKLYRMPHEGGIGPLPRETGRRRFDLPAASRMGGPSINSAIKAAGYAVAGSFFAWRILTPDPYGMYAGHHDMIDIIFRCLSCVGLVLAFRRGWRVLRPER